MSEIWSASCNCRRDIGAQLPNGSWATAPNPNCPTCKGVEVEEFVLVVVEACPQSSEMGCLQSVSDEYCNKYGEGICELTRPLTVSEVESWISEQTMIRPDYFLKFTCLEIIEQDKPTFKGRPVRVVPKEAV